MPYLEKYGFTFTDTDLILITGTAHGLHTADLGLALYEVLAGSRRLWLAPGSFEVDDMSLDVRITLGQRMSGRGVLFG
jgi:hypothetical protein